MVQQADDSGGPEAIGHAEAFRLDSFLPYQLSVAAESMSRLFARRYERAYGLTRPEWRVLAVLAAEGVLAMQDLIERTQMDAVRASRAGARLAEKGLIERHANPADHRALRLSLTPAGHALHAAIAPLAVELERELTSFLSEQDRARLEELLTRLSERARAMDDAGRSP